MVQVILHPKRWGGEILKGIKDGPVFRTDVNGYKVQFPVVPNPTCRGYLGEYVPIWVGEMAVVGPSRGRFP